MKRLYRRSAFCTVCALLLCGIFAGTAAADGLTIAGITNFGLDGSPQGQGPPAVFGPVNGSAVTSGSGISVATDGSYMQTWSAFSSASATALRAAASSTISCSTNCGTYQVPNASVVSTEASAWFDSVITVQPGQSVASLNFLFSVDGTTTTNGPMTAAAGLTGEVCGLGGGYCYFPEPRRMTNAAVSLNGSSTVTLNMTPWVYNQPFNVEYILGVSADGSTYDSNDNNSSVTGPGSTDVDFSDTARLVAIQAVDANGNVVNDGTVIIDDSGTNLPGTIPAPAPEPTTFCGLGMGLLMLAAARFKARKQIL